MYQAKWKDKTFSITSNTMRTLCKRKFGLHSELRCLGLLAVRNSYTPLQFFLRKTALRQVAHRDVTRPHYVRSSHLPKSAALRLCNQRLLRSFASLRHNGADVKLRPQFAFAYANANSDSTPSYAVLFKEESVFFHSSYNFVKFIF